MKSVYHPDASPLVLFGKTSWRWFVRLLARAARSASFRRNYALTAVGVLFASTLLWAILGARLQVHNADQLSDPYLFSSWATFQGASFPGSHTFLLKWPIFWLVSVFGVSSTSLLVATVAVVLVTVATLTAILYKIDRRPLVFGTVCLGLSLALLLIPAQPYAGGILPVNMAMLTTRNLEYAVYLVSLALFARARRLRSKGFLLGVALLALLIASDKLFLSLSVGGSLVALLVYALFSNWSVTAFMVRWLVGSIGATLGSVALLLSISAVRLTHLTSSVVATPYGVLQSGKSVVLGVAYAILGFLTNAGANPAYDNTVLGQLPGSMAHRLWSVTGLVYLVTASLLLYALVAVWRVVHPTLRTVHSHVRLPAAHLLALALIWSTVAACAVFVVTNHYYAVDARYLTIGFFALVVSLAVWLRRLDWQRPESLLIIGCGLVVSLVLAGVMAFHISTGQTTALTAVSTRNDLVVAALKRHKVDVLVGDYWRVLPIKLASNGNLTVTPLSSCTQPVSTLTSSAWQPNLTKHSFAYLVTLDGSLTDFPACSLAQITAKYGHPNATQIIAGSLARPREALLFYDQGGHMPQRAVTQVAQAILPIALERLDATDCNQPTIMNVVAHQDDDLLFLSPDLLHDIQSGRCVRTVFLTAGDSGQGKFYWLDRQLGAEAAYSSMLGSKAVWDQQTVKLAPDEYVTVATPHDNPKVSLVFFNLPDGNLQGQGFARSGQQSLAKLHAGAITHLRTVDGQSSYTSQQLVDALSMLMNTYQPAAIHTQANVPSDTYPDHSDHITTGLYADSAATQYDQQHFGDALAIPVIKYIGYPIHGYASNISDGDLAQKEAAFLAYARYDGGVCHSVVQCAETPTYGAYISRQYTEDAGEQ